MKLLPRLTVVALGLLSICPFVTAEPLKIAYSDWPGFVAWEIGIQKGWFKEAGVEVDFQWFDYVPSMDAYVAGKVDATGLTNGDALVIGATGKPSVCIIITDYSNGNDMVVGAPGIESIKDLKGKKVGLEEGFVSHLVLLTALEKAGLKAEDVTIVNTPTNETPQVLASKAVDAVAAWQPSSGQALKAVPGSKPIFTSANVPGLIYDGLYISPESLEKRRGDWLKVTKVWYRIVEYMQKEENIDDVLKILSARVKVTPEEYEPFLKGTRILNVAEALECWKEESGFSSIHGSSKIADEFNVKFKVYEKNQDIVKYLDSSFTLEVKDK